MNNNNKQKVKDILAKYNLRTIKRDNNTSNIQLNEKKTKIASPPVTYTIPNPKNIIKITPEPQIVKSNNSIQVEKPISIQKIINNDRIQNELLEKKNKNTMPTAIIPNNVKIKPNIYDFIPTIKEPILENNQHQQQYTNSQTLEKKNKNISIKTDQTNEITPIKNTLDNIKQISTGLQKNNLNTNKKINPLLIIPKLNNITEINQPSNKNNKPIELKKVFIDEKINENQSLKNTGIHIQNQDQSQIKVLSRPIDIQQQPTITSKTNTVESNIDHSNNDSIKILERKRLELIKMQNEELQKLKMKKEQITKLSNQKKEQALLKSIELEKQKLFKIHQQKQKVTNLLQQQNIKPVQKQIQNLPLKKLSTYDTINNLNANNIFNNNKIPNVIEPIIINNDTNLQNKVIQTNKNNYTLSNIITKDNNMQQKNILEKNVETNLEKNIETSCKNNTKNKYNNKTLEQYSYYTKKDFPNIKWNSDNIYTSTLQFINNISNNNLNNNNNNLSQDEQFNLLKSTYGFKHLDKLKETDKLKLPKLYNCLYNILFIENFIKIKLCT